MLEFVAPRWEGVRQLPGEQVQNIILGEHTGSGMLCETICQKRNHSCSPCQSRLSRLADKFVYVHEIAAQSS